MLCHSTMRADLGRKSSNGLAEHCGLVVACATLSSRVHKMDETK